VLLVRDGFSAHRPGYLESDHGVPEPGLLPYMACQAGKPVIDRLPPAQRGVTVRLEREPADTGIAAAQP
jgi:hypothetical protein